MKQTFILILLPIFASAQLQTFKAPVSQWGHTANAVLYVPEEAKANPLKKFPTIIFFHGAGESGTDVSKLVNGPFLGLIKNGFKPSAVNPITGEYEPFIVIAGQGADWCLAPDAMKIAYDYIVDTYKVPVDTNRIYVTGLSAGGQGSLKWAIEYPNLTTALVPASPGALEPNYVPRISEIAKDSISTWFWSGASDPTFTSVANAYSAIITKAGGTSIVQTYPGGHCCWNDLYSGKATRSYKGVNLNFYEWLLTNSKIPIPPIVIPPVKYIQILHDPTAVKKVIVLDKDGKWTEYEAGSITSGEIKIETK